MARRQRDDFVAVIEEQGLGGDKKGTNPSLHDGGECIVDMGFGGGVENTGFMTKCLRHGSHFDPFQFARWIVWVREHSKSRRLGDQLAQQPQPLRRKRGREEGDTVTLPPGRLRLVTSPGATGSPPIAKTIGIDVVADFAANPAGVPLMAAITAT
jgi:hypothetical protein